MKNMKKISAAFLAVVMVISMLSCMAFSTVAATVGGPTSVEVIIPAGNQVLTGAALPSNVVVVSSKWGGTAKGKPVFVKLGNQTYRASFGVNAFTEINDAVAVAKNNGTVYVGAGSYSATINLADINQLKIYGPWAGVSPNNPNFTCAEDLRDANPARPAADVTDVEEAAKTEAVFTGTVNLCATVQPDSFTTLEGLYFAGSSTISLGNGGIYRVGTILRNNIVNVSTTQFINMNRGQNPGFVAEHNRVLNGKQFHGTGGFMGSIHRYNYFNLTDYMFHPGSMQNGNVGQIANIECNYFETCSGILYYGSNNYQVVAYSVIIKDNYINSVAQGKYIVNNEFDAFHSQPGITFQITGNQIYGVPKSTILFQFPYRASEHNLNRYRYIININDNVIDLPKNLALVNAQMAGKIDCSNNTFLQGIEMKQFIYDSKDCSVVLYPYYTADGTVVGDAKLLSIVGGEVDEENKTAALHLGNAGVDCLELEDVLVTTGDFEVYEDATLLTKVEDKVLYFDSYMTTRYIAVLAPDGAIANVYELTVTQELGQSAKLLAVQENSNAVTVSQNGSKFTVDMPADLPYLDYTLKTSAGATVELYADSEYTTPAEVKGNYIPYGKNGKYYTLYVKVISEDGTSAINYYTVEFVRDRSALYDPSITAIKSPAGNYSIRPDRADNTRLWMAYYAGEKLLSEQLFEFETTPGATYKIYDTKGTLVSSSEAPKALKLKEGVNNFTIKVKDDVAENTMSFDVSNGTRSSDVGISGVIGQAPVMVNDTITLIAGGSTLSATFETRSPYATVKIYADAAKTVELKYSSTPVTEFETNRIIDERTFSIPSAHAVNYYYLVCIAEDGTKKDYKLILTKTVNPIAYADVNEDVWYAPYIETATMKGILVGEAKDEGTYFRPSDNTSRQEMATIIARLMGVNGAAFADLKLGYADAASIAPWAADNVKACTFFKVFQGSNEGGKIYFKPTNNISRQEVMITIAKMLNLKGDANLSAFKDGNKVAPWAAEYVEACIANGIIAGDNNGKLNPEAYITRAELATIVSRIVTAE